MNIKGLDYNTERSRLTLREYGRKFQTMVDHCLTISDKHQRQVCAENIVRIMQRMDPKKTGAKGNTDKYWDLLAIMADFKLDIDYPCDITQAQNVYKHPDPLPYDKCYIPAKHYGSTLFEMFEQLKNIPEGPELDILVELTANRMKQCLAMYGQGAIDNERVADDLAKYTDGRIQLDLEHFHFARVNLSETPIGNKQNADRGAKTARNNKRKQTKGKETVRGRR